MGIVANHGVAMEIDAVNHDVVLSFTQTGPLSYDDFQRMYFTAQQIAEGAADPEIDFDGDGQSNRAEWIHGTDPTNGTDSLPGLEISAAGNGGLELSFPEYDHLPVEARPFLQVYDAAAPSGWTTLMPGQFESLADLPVGGRSHVTLRTIRITDPNLQPPGEHLFRLATTG